MLRRINNSVGILLLIFACFGSKAVQIDDDITPTDKPRIVSAGGSITEILFALGAQDSIVGVDSSSLYPATATDIANVGYYRQLSLEGVVSVNPTLVVGLSSMGPVNVLTQLESLNVRVDRLPLERSVNGLTNTIQHLGNLVNKPIEAKRLIEETQQELAVLPSLKATNKRIVFLMSASSRGLLAAGNDTVPNLIFELLHLKNPFAHIDGFKPVSNEVVIAINPDLILIPNHQKAGRSVEEICRLPGLKLWSQAKGCQIKFVDSLSFLGMTPRLPQAAQKVSEWVIAMDNKDA